MYKEHRNTTLQNQIHLVLNWSCSKKCSTMKSGKCIMMISLSLSLILLEHFLSFKMTPCSLKLIDSIGCYNTTRNSYCFLYVLLLVSPISSNICASRYAIRFASSQVVDSGHRSFKWSICANQVRDLNVFSFYSHTVTPATRPFALHNWQFKKLYVKIHSESRVACSSNVIPCHNASHCCQPFLWNPRQRFSSCTEKILTDTVEP